MLWSGLVSFINVLGEIANGLMAAGNGTGMLMSDLIHISFACKAHLNMTIENALYKFIIIILLRACSLNFAKFCLICLKICQREVISSANDFLHPPKFLHNETSKILSTSFGGCKNFVRRENPFFLDIHLSLDHQISQHMDYEANVTV